jgi:fructose-bisphosphate aldolase class II
VALTRAAVKIAHAKKIGVEAELGQLKGVEDEVASEKQILTDPAEAKKFMNATNADYLAVAIGTSHGAYKFKGKSNIDIKRLREINAAVEKPLTLHGASSVPQTVVAKANRYGADIVGAKGVSEWQIRKAVRNGIAKVNEDTDLRLALVATVREFLKKHPKEYDPRKIFAPAIAAIKEVVKQRIKVLGSEGKAR